MYYTLNLITSVHLKYLLKLLNEFNLTFSGVWLRLNCVYQKAMIPQKLTGLVRATLELQSAVTCSHWFLAEGIRSSETSVHTRSTRRHIPEQGILQPN
jgi:hypothetical protein